MKYTVSATVSSTAIISPIICTARILPLSIALLTSSSTSGLSQYSKGSFSFMQITSYLIVYVVFDGAFFRAPLCYYSISHFYPFQ